MDFGSWAAWASVAVAIFGLGSIFYQMRKQRQLNSANLLLALESKFGEASMLTARRQFAELVKNNLHSIDNALTGYHPIVSFYDMLGSLVNRGVLDERLIWYRFGWRIIRGWLSIAMHPTQSSETLPAPASLIDRMRSAEQEPRIYEMFEWIGNRFVKLDCKFNRSGKKHTLQQLYDMVMQYHKQESTLKP